MIQLFSIPLVKYLAAALAAVLLLGGTYIKGRMDGVDLTEAKYAEEKRKWQDEVAQKQQEYDQEISKLRDEYRDEVKRYRDEIQKLQNNPQVVTQYVDRFVPVKTQCTIPEGFVELHNRSAAGRSLESAPQNPERPSNRTLNNAAAVIAENYYRCNELIARLNALQDLVIEYQKRQKELTK